jgi:hypothetical protein
MPPIGESRPSGADSPAMMRKTLTAPMKTMSPVEVTGSTNQSRTV